MRKLIICTFLLLVVFGFFSCTDTSELAEEKMCYTVSEDSKAKGSTTILSGLGTYKTGKYVTVKAKLGALISGQRTSGSGSISSTYESGGYACADINDIHGDWTVSAHIPDFTVTVKAGTGGTVSGGGTVEKGGSVNISASPSSGYGFDGWTLTSGSGTFGSVSSSSTAFKPNSNCTVVANFKKTQKNRYTVSVTCLGKIGYVSMAANGIDWIDGSTRTFEEGTVVYIGAYWTTVDNITPYWYDARTNRLLYTGDPYIFTIDKDVYIKVSDTELK